MISGKFAVWMLPQLFAYALNFPIQKFLQAQRKVMVMAVVAGVVLVIHVVLSWLLILKLKWGLVGAAVTLNLSWWLVVIGQLGYIFAGTCGQAWSGFSWLAFRDLFQFVKLSIASAVMLWSVQHTLTYEDHFYPKKIYEDHFSKIQFQTPKSSESDWGFHQTSSTLFPWARWTDKP